jgi:sugar phosphate permease
MVAGDLLLPFLSDHRSGVARGRGGPAFVYACALVLGYLGFRVFSINIMVRRISIVIVGIMVFQPILLLVGGDVGAG